MTRRILITLLAAGALVTVLAAPAVAHVAVDRTEVTTFGDPTEITGRSLLVRTHRGALGIVRTTGLTEGDAYTMWAVVFNRPENCDGPCDGGDLANADVEGASILVDGRVASARRRTMFFGRLPNGGALTNVPGAEIHFVIRTHGPVIPGMLEEQLSTLSGGCPPNACANVQAAIHLP